MKIKNILLTTLSIAILWQLYHWSSSLVNEGRLSKVLPKIKQETNEETQVLSRGLNEAPSLSIKENKPKFENDTVKENYDWISAFYSAEFDFLSVDTEHELHEHLMSLWDGKSEFIEDYNYTIEVTILDNVNKLILFYLSRKQLGNAPSYTELLNNVDKLLQDEELKIFFGDESPENTAKIQYIFDDLSSVSPDINLDAISCREKKCVLLVAAKTQQEFDIISTSLLKNKYQVNYFSFEGSDGIYQLDIHISDN